MKIASRATVWAPLP